MARPMLGGVELQQVQQLQVDADQVLVQHGVPALEGALFQGLGRRATQITLTGVLTGPEAGEGLKTLRAKFHAAEPVPFVADLTTATRVDQVLIEEMGVRDLAGKPERFEYALTLREYAPTPEVKVPPEIETPENPAERIDERLGTLIVEVIVEGQPSFDYDRITVTVRGTQEDGTDLTRTLTNRTEDNVWTEDVFPAGAYTVEAVETNPQSMSGSAQASVQAGQQARVSLPMRLSFTLDLTAPLFTLVCGRCCDRSPNTPARIPTKSWSLSAIRTRSAMIRLNRRSITSRSLSGGGEVCSPT